jgi:hypothetical protein
LHTKMAQTGRLLHQTPLSVPCTYHNSFTPIRQPSFLQMFTYKSSAFKNQPQPQRSASFVKPYR